MNFLLFSSKRQTANLKESTTLLSCIWIGNIRATKQVYTLSEGFWDNKER